MKKIAVAGTGYVGLSIATLLAQHNDVVAVDIVQERVDKVNNRQSPIQDDYIERFFAEDTRLQQGTSEKDYILENPLQLTATTDWENGSTLLEMDTGNVFVYDAANKVWRGL